MRLTNVVLFVPFSKMSAGVANQRLDYLRTVKFDCQKK